ncbi:MAG: hypothetical protein LUD02_05485 [Tannerellaceae bacterium]|nr:hypothetical protein [Tannerellaceae bacterium]
MKTNDHILQGIKNYLSSDSTDYAVMICGEWSTGKTYFLRHTLRDEVFCKPIERIKEDGEKESIHFQSIYISLAGMKSLEMLETRLRERNKCLLSFQPGKPGHCK